MEELYLIGYNIWTTKKGVKNIGNAIIDRPIESKEDLIEIEKDMKKEYCTEDEDLFIMNYSKLG